jgi:hypothetical protein
MSVPSCILGVDLGKATDHTAIILAEPNAVDLPTYDITHIERVDLHTRYTEVVRHVCEDLIPELRKPVLCQQYSKQIGAEISIERKPSLTLMLDYTGVGMAVAEMFADASPDCDLILVTITGGQKVTMDDEGLHIPKGELVSAVQRVLQEERIRLPADDPHVDTLTTELTDFQANITLSGHVTYGAAEGWRSGKHDDLVLAAAMALWWGESGPRVWVG